MKTAIFVLSLALTGCSSFGPEKVDQLNSLISQGRCTEAEALAGNTNDPVRFSNMGVVAHNCERNAVKARGYYEYGARLGEQSAINNLLRNNWPVPSPDVRAANDASSASRSAEQANALLLLQAAQPKPPQNKQQSCTTRFYNGVAYTDCN
jgi:hypothetical protein